MIKVIAKNTVQAIEIIEAFKDTTATLTIELKNTTATNSDVIKIIENNTQVLDQVIKLLFSNEIKKSFLSLIQ